MDALLAKLAESPIVTAERASKIFLPKGRRPVKRGAKADYYDGVSAPKIARSEVEKRKVDAFSAKIVAVLDYYATTAVPFDRIAAHTKLTVEQVTESMARRGRAS